MVKKFKPPTNQQLVAAWLKGKEWNYSHIARHTGVSNPVLTRFKQGKTVPPKAIIQIAEFTGLPLKVFVKGCDSELLIKR